MRGIALKIFLSFWLTFAVMLASFAILPERGSGVRFTDHVRQHGLIASALLDEHGAQSCADFSAILEQRSHIQLVLFDEQRTAVCRSPAADPAVFTSYMDRSRDLVERTAGGMLALLSIQSPSGAIFTAAGASLPGFDATITSPPFPRGTVGLAIVISGLVCFAVARYLARPLQLVRDTSYRLAAGDLQARAGPGIGHRRDEIGDLVRDFDTMAARIEALVHSQGQLLSDISHELRSPLARLNVALELARRKAGPDARVDLDRIETEAERMNELIGRVLALARAENAKGSRMASVDLSVIVRKVTDDADYEARRQQKSVELRVAATPSVNGDAQLIESALDNVVRNAVHHTREQSTVDVTLDATERGALVIVRDHGPGVPPSELDRIFSPFHRVTSTKNRETSGFGLGLAIAQRAVEVHGGDIAAENALDGGLRMTIRLPSERPAHRVDRG